MSAARQSGLYVRDGLVIPEDELEVRATRAGGPGGQNVNKVSTRIELRFDVAASNVLRDEQKRRILGRLCCEEILLRDHKGKSRATERHLPKAVFERDPAKLALTTHSVSSMPAPRSAMRS